MNKKYDYSSIHVDFDPEAAKEFLARGKALVGKSVLYKPEVKGFEDSPHITVLYGIHADSPSVELIEVIQTHPKFTITLGSIGVFKDIEKDGSHDALIVNVNAPDLYILNHYFKEICEHTSIFFKYIPHATIAYVKSGSCDHLEGLNKFKGLSFIANRLTFSGKYGTQRYIFLGRK